ncbi:unnamed protein product [Brassica napus]|uniref:(rape) hypothetical protein n=1 Tax=Brassica napus TaxID=3708 RepID=A0A816IGN3_BRANA|nr:unnamed protein product [Brassica napus]
MISLGRSLNVFRLGRHMIHLMEKARETISRNWYLCVVFRLVRHMKVRMEKTRMTTLSNRYLSLESVRKTQENVVKRIRLMTNHS